MIINSGSIVAEYGICSENKPNRLTLDPDNVLDSLPSKIVNSYVHNWCVTHAHIHCYDTDKIKISTNNIINTDNIQVDIPSSSSQSDEQNIAENSNEFCQYLSSGESLNKSNISRESGILTIPSSDTSQDENLIDVFNNCIIINDESTTKTTNSSAYITCDSVNSFEKNIYSIMTLDLTENSIKNITSNNEIVQNTNLNSMVNLTENINHVTNIPCQLSQHNETNDSVVSITEEYKYVDEENDIILIEKRILVNPKRYFLIYLF